MALSPQLRGMVSSAKKKYKNNSGKTVKPKEGRNVYRILAPTSKDASWIPADGQFWADLGVHWIKADENAKPLAVVGDCEIVYQKPSVINTAIGMAVESAMDEESKKLFESWKARKSVLINALDRNDNNTNIVLELTPTTFSKFLELMVLYDDAGQDITDPSEGVDIVITRTGKGLNTEYDMAVAPGVSKPVSNDQLRGATDLWDFIEGNFFRGEEQKALNAIQQVAGIATPALPGGNSGAGSSTPTAALTSAAASVEDAKPETTAAPATPDPEEEERRQAQQRRAEQQRAEQQRAAQEASEPVQTTVKPETPSMDRSEEDALLAELDNLDNM